MTDGDLNKRTLTLFLFLVVAAAPLRGQSFGTPLATAPYVPLSVGEKAKIHGNRIISPTSFAKSAFMAGINHWQNTPEEWGQGMEGYGKRLGHKLATRGFENSIGFLVAAPLHQDPRYFRSGETGFLRRSGHAMKSTFVTRTDSGGQTFAVWRFAGNYGAQFISNHWRPERQTGTGDTLIRGTISVGYDMGSNWFKEFWPDIRKHVLHR
jgi:hypothetical protein